MRCFALLVCFLGFGTVPVSGADLTGTVAVERPTRVRLPGPVTFQLNYLRQRGDLPRIKSHSIDVSATYSFRMDR